jgi:hypothetical protein
MRGEQMILKKFAITVFAFSCVLCIANASNAKLFDRGAGLIYDDLLDITWLQYANYSGLTMTWDEATNWVGNLVYQGYDDWRLPVSDTSCSGYDCAQSEMGHLFSMEGITSDTPGIFMDVRPYMYWSATEDSSDVTKAYRFNFSSGSQGTSSKALGRYAWAVRNGDSAPPVAPEPVSSALFISGGVTFGIRRYFGNRTD